ncbi:hypothetical protein B0T25DRAFT_342206 [Lasiosphaeria hispida]|uniref:Mitochondrial intermediate peptidase n=1 Tax=Lasiosphaeria hispida TaxID=260671 RepID=A0AAJ0M8A0_9PEZI|nr:hypothetical protein B0T25DRAFT_342206 [Lasiosphaeria hispida]
MLLSLRPWRWVCPSCLLRVPVTASRQIRWLSSSQLRRGSKPQGFALVQALSFKPIPKEPLQSPDLLRDIFDSPDVWKEFSAYGSKPAGLFRNSYLKTPQGFLEFAHVSLKKAHTLVDKVLGASSLDEYRLVVRHLDRLSDILCRVLDMADFVRVTHPRQQTQRAASEAWGMVYQYMNELNTMTGLNDQLAKAMENPQVAETWSEEEKMVAEVLRLDFAKSAVNLPKSFRDRFVDLSSEISRVSTEFVQDMEPAQDVLFVPTSQLAGMDPTVVKAHSRDRSSAYLPTLSGVASMALRQVNDASIRKKVFYASRTASAKSVATLENLMRLRAELATLSGFESYGHLALRDRMMARSPEAVQQFLKALVSNNKPRALEEAASLYQAKVKLHSQATQLDPWDKEYYSDKIRTSMRSTEKHDDFLSSYFSLGTVVRGISRIISALYGLKLVPSQSMVGETWHKDVRRLDVLSDTDGLVAVLYFDLLYRPNKSPNPAHFTLRCSREISAEELAEGATMVGPDLGTPELVATDGMAFSKQNDVVKQLPTIALVCDFPKPKEADTRPTLLTFFQVETLFHEIGHAIHSILARTSFQNVSGTRCATDLAELPSTLMEYFASDPTVLGAVASHYETGKPLPYNLLAPQLRQARRFEASDTENQIILAMLDQGVHSRAALDPKFDTTRMYLELQKKYSSSPPDPPGTSWQGFFGHLSGYGSTYYSYLFDRVLAQRVWDVVFDAGAGGGSLRRENGERLKEGLLKWGGGRDPWKCLADVLKDERLADGGEQAMALVGSWGLGSQLPKTARAPEEVL